MGQLRFVMSCREHFAERAIEFAYVAGMEGIPWPSRCRCAAVADGTSELVVERAVSESGNLYLPWCVDDFGEVMLSTASLMERTRPYQLTIEVARGTLNRLRNQLADWQLCCSGPVDELESQVRSITKRFSRVVTGCDSCAAAAESEQLIRDTLKLAEQAASDFGREFLSARTRDRTQASALFGGRLPLGSLTDNEESFAKAAWNTAFLSFSWRSIESSPGNLQWGESDRQIQWCTRHGMRIVGGPLLRLARADLPDWLYLWEHDFEQVQRLVLQFVRAVVHRYQGQVSVWNSLAGINVPGDLEITEEQRLRLAVTVLDELRHADPSTPTLATLDQPWGEYLARGQVELSPLHFADALLRADLGLAAIGLELNIGYWPGGTLPRDTLEVSRQLDRWSMLGLPLVVFLTLPSDSTPSPSARLQVRSPCWDGPAPSIGTQLQSVERLLPLVLSKPYVLGLCWNQLSDQSDVHCAHAGCFDGAGNAKPLCGFWTNLFQEQFA